MLNDSLVLDWPAEDYGRVPYRLYSDPVIYARELERIFYGRHWNYVGLEAELPEPRSFRTTIIGERGVIVTRDRNGDIHVVENRCAHRGVRFCRARAARRSPCSAPITSGTMRWTGG